jgi:hypothetical protein
MWNCGSFVHSLFRVGGSLICATPEQVKHFRGPCAARCKPLAPCCCVSADGEAIFGCVPTDRKYFLPACLHMALCPQLGCDPMGGDESEDADCKTLCFATLVYNLFVCCLQHKRDSSTDHDFAW